MCDDHASDLQQTGYRGAFGRTEEEKEYMKYIWCLKMKTNVFQEEIGKIHKKRVGNSKIPYSFFAHYVKKKVNTSYVLNEKQKAIYN